MRMTTEKRQQSNRSSSRGNLGSCGTIKATYAIVLVGGATILPHGHVAAQGANVDVTVIPSYSAGQPQPSREGFLVCIGTAVDRDQFGSQITSWNGVANQNFKNLPVGAQVIVTVNKAGFAGLERNATLHADWNNHVQVNPQAGNGGPSCPGFSPPAPTGTPTGGTATRGATHVQVAGTPIFPVSPTSGSGTQTAVPGATRAPQAIYPDEYLPMRGNVRSTDQVIDCRQFGPNYFLVGLRGQAGMAIDRLSAVCSYGDNESIGDHKSPQAVGGMGGTSFYRFCGTFEFVYAISGTVDNNQVRSLHLHCKDVGAINPGKIDMLNGIGNHVGSNFGPDRCTQNRLVQAIRIRTAPFATGTAVTNAVAPTIVSGIQLICRTMVMQ